MNYAPEPNHNMRTGLSQHEKCKTASYIINYAVQILWLYFFFICL